MGASIRVVPESELKKAQVRIRRFERLLGIKAGEVEVLKEAVLIGREKNSSRSHSCEEWKISNEGYPTRPWGL